jgi:predicted dehydrogenase
VAGTLNIGIIGCGNIFPQYIRGCRLFDILNIVACADLDLERSRARAAEFHIPRAVSVDELLADPSIEIVINLTVPQAHAQVSRDILNAGKHVYSEKPLALNRDEGASILRLAQANELLLGCAPDTFLGGGIQTCRKLIDEGAIGTPVAATAFMCIHGHESWHPNPEFYYQPGGGPMFDMGPYYLTALINLLGPVRRVSASTRKSFPVRERKRNDGQQVRIEVEVPTHIAGTMDFASGAVGSMITSFDTWQHHLPIIEIYGSDGSLSVPDPNIFGGKVFLTESDSKVWEEVPLSHSDKVGRGIGVADMAYALRLGRAHRASGELAYHVLDLMQSFHESSDQDRHIPVQSVCAQPEPLPAGIEIGTLDH